MTALSLGGRLSGGEFFASPGCCSMQESVPVETAVVNSLEEVARALRREPVRAYSFGEIRA